MTTNEISLAQSQHSTTTGNYLDKEVHVHVRTRSRKTQRVLIDNNWRLIFPPQQQRCEIATN